MADSKDTKSAPAAAGDHKDEPATAAVSPSAAATNAKATKDAPPTADINRWCTAAWAGNLAVLEAEPKASDPLWRGYVYGKTGGEALGLFRVCADNQEPMAGSGGQRFRVLPLSAIEQSADYAVPALYYAAAAGQMTIIDYILTNSQPGEAAAVCVPVHFAHANSGANPPTYSVKENGFTTMELTTASDVARANGFLEIAHRLENSAAECRVCTTGECVIA